MSPQTMCRAVCHGFKGTGLRAEQGEGGSKSQAFARPRDLLRAAYVLAVLPYNGWDALKAQICHQFKTATNERNKPPYYPHKTTDLNKVFSVH